MGWIARHADDTTVHHIQEIGSVALVVDCGEDFGYPYRLDESYLLRVISDEQMEDAEHRHLKRCLKCVEILEMPVFEIWSEGYAATGDHGTATFIGTTKGCDFREACRNYAEAHPKFKDLYDPRRNTYWGCHLFDNEVQARASFG